MTFDKLFFVTDIYSKMSSNIIGCTLKHCLSLGWSISQFHPMHLYCRNSKAMKKFFHFFSQKVLMFQDQPPLLCPTLGKTVRWRRKHIFQISTCQTRYVWTKKTTKSLLTQLLNIHACQVQVWKKHPIHFQCVHNIISWVTHFFYLPIWVTLPL